MLDLTGRERGRSLIPLRLSHQTFSPENFMNSEILTAEIAQIKVGGLEFQGLRFGDGCYGIALPQIGNLFSISLPKFWVKAPSF